MPRTPNKLFVTSPNLFNIVGRRTRKSFLVSLANLLLLVLLLMEYCFNLLVYKGYNLPVIVVGITLCCNNSVRFLTYSTLPGIKVSIPCWLMAWDEHVYINTVSILIRRSAAGLYVVLFSYVHKGRCVPESGKRAVLLRYDWIPPDNASFWRGVSKYQVDKLRLPLITKKGPHAAILVCHLSCMFSECCSLFVWCRIFTGVNSASSSE